MTTPPRHLGKYELHELLGRGGMAEVWKAFDTQLRRYVAIKLLHPDLLADPDFMTRFIREAQVIAALHHPNIVQIHDFHTSQPSESNSTSAYMVMDYVEGQTLADYISNTSRQGKFPPPADIVHLFTSISQAVDYAHRQGMIHRDIKPSNILLDKRNTSRNPMGEPILSDFGIAKLLGTMPGTLSGAWLGTPLYISPEQVQDSSLTERTDIYALGVVLYEIFTGVPPFRGNSPAAIMMQHLNDLPTPPSLINPHIPPSLTVVLLRGLAKDPWARFPSASSMTAALAEAFNLPVPEGFDLPSYPADPMNMPTYLSPRANRPRGLTPSIGPRPTPPYVTPSDSQLSSGGSTISMEDSLPNTPATPNREGVSISSNSLSSDVKSIAQGGGIAEPAKNHTVQPNQTPTTLTPSSPGTTPAIAHSTLTPAVEPAHTSATTPPIPLPPAAPGLRKYRGWRIALPIVLIFVLVGSGLGALLLLFHGNTGGTVTTSPIVGQAFFVSSGQLNENSTQGSNDEFQVTLQNVHDPQPGKSYYAWLLGDENQTEAPPVSLGKVMVDHGSVVFFYKGDSQHSNLLESTSRFLITEEDANVIPSTPSFNLSTWRYFAQLPHQRAPGQTFSMLDHLRHLLTNDPKLKARGLPGGLNIWLFRNTEKILEWAGSARDDWGTHEFPLMHRQIVRILDYLDGTSFVRQDVPAGTPVLANAHNAQVALLEFDTTTQDPPGYLYHIGLHLNGVIAAPGSTANQRDLATQINKAINNVKARLTQVHQDAVQLVKMDDAHLALPSSLALLNDMATQANYAYIGRNNPSTNELEAGVAQIYLQIQHLATFDVKPYKP